MVTDFLSRLHEHQSTGECYELTTAKQNLLSDIVASYDNDATAQSITQGISTKDEKFK